MSRNKTLELNGCEGLTSLPDLSALKKLEVKYLPNKLQPWEENRRKAFTIPTQ